MDRNSIIGIVLIGVILIGYSIFTKPAREAQMEAIKRNDSIAKVEQARQQELQREQTQNLSSLPVEESDDKITDEQQENFGVFSNALEGDEQIITLENELIKLDFSTLGGRPYSATLKEYSTHDSLPVVLFDGDSSKFDLQFFADNRRISTNELYFVTQSAKSEYVVTDQAKSIVMRLDISDESYIEYTYSLRPHEYMIDFDIRFVGLDELRADNMVYQYEIFFPSTEKGFQNENNYTTLYYRYKEGDIEKFRLRSKKSIEEESALTQLEWVAYKHQFFSTVMIAKDYFESAYMMNERYDEPGKYVRHFYSEIDLPYDRTSADQKMSMAFYFGPNHHQTLKEYDQWKLENLVTVGGSVIRWLNEFVIIKIFNWLNNYIANYGIIILLLTLILKTALFPLTYKSYKSQAVMRVLKPQVEEINAKFPKKEDAMKKQQATMDLYRKAGANPLGGCLPMLLQMPILYAMFRFFPSSIELRGESFLWADDLSTYDSILDLPFNIPMYGDHVSLFTILMTVTTVLSMRINNQTQSSSAMPGMKTMMYIMPVMFMVFLNNFSAALTYYYFLANLITLGQNLIFKAFTDEEAILKKINARKSKPKKKSKWQARLEEMTKQQQQMQKSKGKR
ncbi:MAG TPA: membrane protein insertase YidC [Bacteroidales bacterium]|nr:membrane protein insertase YidC [Bacteroidales bacterium]